MTYYVCFKFALCKLTGGDSYFTEISHKKTVSISFLKHPVILKKSWIIKPKLICIYDPHILTVLVFLFHPRWSGLDRSPLGLIFVSSLVGTNSLFFFFLLFHSIYMVNSGLGVYYVILAGWGEVWGRWSMHHHHGDLVSTASFSYPPGSVKKLHLGWSRVQKRPTDTDCLTYQSLQTSLYRHVRAKCTPNQILVQKVIGFLMFSPMIPGQDLLQ